METAGMIRADPATGKPRVRIDHAARMEREMPDEDSLIEWARREAMMKNDAVALADILAERFLYAHINGIIDDREAYLQRIGSGKTLYTRSTIRDAKPDIRDGYALLTGISTIGYKWADGSAEGEVETFFTSVWEPSGDRWKLAVYASTPLS
jgi:hypothetical protein